MTTKYLKNVSTMLAVVSAVTEVDLDHINYSRHNMYSHVYLNNLLRREKSIWYSASGSGVSFITVHIHHCSHSDLAAHYLNKETKRTVGLFRSSFIRHPYSKRIDKNWHIHSKIRTFYKRSRNRCGSCWWSYSCRGSWKQTFRGFSPRVSGG